MLASAADLVIRVTNAWHNRLGNRGDSPQRRVISGRFAAISVRFVPAHGDCPRRLGRVEK